MLPNPHRVPFAAFGAAALLTIAFSLPLAGAGAGPGVSAGATAGGALPAPAPAPTPAPAASAAGDAKPAGATEVTIDNFSFTPRSIHIAAGGTVSWVNHDDVPHTVVADDRSWKSKALDTDGRFSYTFAKPGKYPYFCGMHPKMTGEVVVDPVEVK